MDCPLEQLLPATPAPLWPALTGKGDSLSLPGCEGPQDAAASWDSSTVVQDLCLNVYYTTFPNVPKEFWSWLKRVALEKHETKSWEPSLRYEIWERGFERDKGSLQSKRAVPSTRGEGTVRPENKSQRQQFQQILWSCVESSTERPRAWARAGREDGRASAWRIYVSGSSCRSIVLYFSAVLALISLQAGSAQGLYPGLGGDEELVLPALWQWHTLLSQQLQPFPLGDACECESYQSTMGNIFLGSVEHVPFKPIATTSSSAVCCIF